jgi:hypothetical protein
MAELIHSLKESKIEKVIANSSALLLKVSYTYKFFFFSYEMFMCAFVCVISYLFIVMILAFFPYIYSSIFLHLLSFIFIQLTEDKLLRTYPGNFRVDSSNYDPIPCWNYGCQLVALNYQTSDLPMQLNRGRFRDNGNCGYLLRPPFLQPVSEIARINAANARAARLKKEEEGVGGVNSGVNSASSVLSSSGVASFLNRVRSVSDRSQADTKDDDNSEEDEEEEEEDEIEFWSPPNDLTTYLLQSRWSTEATSLHVAIYSVLTRLRCSPSSFLLFVWSMFIYHHSLSLSHTHTRFHV